MQQPTKGQIKDMIKAQSKLFEELSNILTDEEVEKLNAICELEHDLTVAESYNN